MTEPAACYGLMCPHRGTCALHEALGTDEGEVIESCQLGHFWPLYRHVDAERD